MKFESVLNQHTKNFIAENVLEDVVCKIYAMLFSRGQWVIAVCSCYPGSGWCQPWSRQVTQWHFGDVIMGAIASQITSLTIVYSAVYSDAFQMKHQSSASLAFVRGIHRRPVNSPHKWPVTRKFFPFDDVIMILTWRYRNNTFEIQFCWHDISCCGIAGINACTHRQTWPRNADGVFQTDLLNEITKHCWD